MRNVSNNIHILYVDKGNVDTSNFVESFNQKIQALEA